MFTRSAVAPPRKRCIRAGRRLIAVDVENVVGGAVDGGGQALWAKSVLQSVLPIAAPDHIVIATSHIGLLAVGCAWPRLRYVVGSGPDGADLALLDVLDENIAERFEEVVIVSGDGIFTDAVVALTAAGVEVTVIAHRDGLSKRLRMAASRVVYFPDRLAMAEVA